MTHRVFSRCFVSIPAALAGIVLAIAPATAEEKSAGPAVDGPVLIALAPTKPEATQFDLRHKLKRGEVLRYEVIDRASFNTTIEQTTQAAQTKTVTVKAWKITDVLPNGDIEFVNVVERVNMVNQLPDHDPTEFDSASDKSPPAGFEDVAKSIGVPLVAIKMTPRGKVVSRDWKLRTPSADESSPIALRLPEKPVAVGDSWDESFDLQVTLEGGATKSIQTRRHHKLSNVANGIATIEVTYQVLSPIDSFVEYQLVQRMTQGDVRFDIDRGRVVTQQMNIDKRILGFAGPASSTHYLMRMEERLLPEEVKVTSKPSRKATVGKRRSPSKTRTATRPRQQQKSRNYRR